MDDLTRYKTIHYISPILNILIKTKVISHSTYKQLIDDVYLQTNTYTHYKYFLTLFDKTNSTEITLPADTTLIGLDKNKYSVKYTNSLPDKTDA
jgi:hypothetical protein